MTSPRFQIVSDLHLETPLESPSYSHFSLPSTFPLEADHLFLLGDIGLIAHTQPLLNFLSYLLRRNAQLKIFYVLGNHEAYHMTLETALAKVTEWESTLNREFGNRFHVMNRRRVDVSPTLTLLGCTLWSHVPPPYQQEVATLLKDLREPHGIWERSVLDHNADHASDLSWLNRCISDIEQNEPEREVMVLTHHSPTIDGRANSKRFPPERAMNSAFRTDLSREKCWTSPRVKVWCFGHTHFSCQFVDKGAEGDERTKLVVSNQKGYAYELGKGNWRIEPVVVGKEDETWKVVIGAREGSEEEVRGEKVKVSARGGISEKRVEEVQS